jgi:rRNA maturation endonuclease Nob1
MTSRKKPAKKLKEPLVRCNGTMTEAQYLSWIRSALRSKSLRWPPRATALELARRPYKGPIKQQKWEYKCAICSKWYKAKEVVVDHFPVGAGSIRSVEDIGAFANNLYCEVENLRVLCSTDHDIHTLAEKLGLTFVEAATEKEIIAICNKKVAEVVDFCVAYGYNESQLSNKDKRRIAVSKILKGVM